LLDLRVCFKGLHLLNCLRSLNLFTNIHVCFDRGVS
jgi:hypothetical protein